MHKQEHVYNSNQTEADTRYACHHGTVVTLPFHYKWSG